MVAFADAPCNSATNGNTADREEKITQMEKLMSDGKRDFYSNNFAAAVSNLGQAVELSVEIYGSTDAGAFDSHLWYGRALFELCNIQEDVLDHAMKNMPEANEDDSIDEERFGDPEKVTEAEKEEVKEKVSEAMSEEVRASNNEEDPSSEAGKQPEHASTGAEKQVAEISTDAEKEPEASSTEDEMQEEEEEGSETEEEDASDIQIAWEVLETARTICEKQEHSKEWDMKKADVLYYLSEVSLLNDDFDKAIEDLTTALDIQQKHLGPNDRGIAQSYLLMARSYKAKDDYENAGKYYKVTKTILLGKIDELKTVDANDDESRKKLAEIEDLESIVSDLDLKIQDAEESHIQLENGLDKIRDQIGLSKKGLVEVTSAPAVDITNMIRKPTKRPADSDVDDTAKKAKGDEETTVTA